MFSSSISVTSLAKKNTTKKFSERNSKINKFLKEKDPFKAVSKKLEIDSNNKSKLVEYDTETVIDPNNKKITISNKKGIVNIDLPYNDGINNFDVIDDKYIFANEEKKFDVAIELVDGGVRQLINIQSADAPNIYDFPLNLELGDTVKLIDDGTVLIYNKKGEIKTTIGKPWARDANNKELKTSYTLVGESLRQSIDLTGAVFPVVADPTWCGDFVSDVSWVKRSWYGREAWSLRLKPTWCLNSHAYTPWSAWEELFAKTPYHKVWPYPQAYGTGTYWSMYNQFACHRDWVKWSNLYEMLRKVSNLTRLTSFEIKEYQDYYHLEPERPDVGYWGSKDAACNQRNDLVGKII
jgi:hypothetical protein